MMMKSTTRLLMPVAALLLSACETVNNNIWFPKFELVRQNGHVHLYSYRSPADRSHPHDSDSAERIRIEQLEVQLGLKELPTKDYRVISREIQYIYSAPVDGYKVYWVNYLVQVPAAP